jgi:thiol-disulfide isomerase/thioredoxin
MVQKAVLDSIARFEGTGDQQGSDLLKALYARRYKLFKTELDEIDLQQALLSIKQYAKGGRADILRMQLMEKWKDQFSFAYPVLLDEIETKWSGRFVQQKLEAAVAGQRQIDELFKTASVIQNGDNYYIGKPVAELPFGARLYKLDSVSKVEDLLTNLRAKFRTRTLILDIWATWCAPCIGDIPNGIKLHRENSDLPIEYIYLCTTSGSDEETWKRRIATLKPPGHHIFIDDVLLTSLRKLLHAEGGYPTYVVIDKDGNVNAKAISFMNGMDREKLKTAAGIQ